MKNKSIKKLNFKARLLFEAQNRIPGEPPSAFKRFRKRFDVAAAVAVVVVVVLIIVVVVILVLLVVVVVVVLIVVVVRPPVAISRNASRSFGKY